jgi:hypothetical protein
MALISMACEYSLCNVPVEIIQIHFLATVSTDIPSANRLMNYRHPEIQSNYSFTKYARHELQHFCKDGLTG